MRGLILLADGFEDTEALTTRDVLLRAGIEAYTASITNNNIVTSSFGLKVAADTIISNITDFSSFDFIVLPGGGRGTANLANSEEVRKILSVFSKQNKIMCAICAAPSVLGKYGYLKNRKYTCFAGFNEGIDGIFTQNEVEKDGNIITARSMQYSIPFALTIIETLLGKDVKEKVQYGLIGLTLK